MSAGHIGRENVKKHGHKGNNGTRWRHGLRQRLVHYRFINNGSNIAKRSKAFRLTTFLSSQIVVSLVFKII